MQEKKVKVKILNGDYAEGELLVYDSPISFLGEVDPKKGAIVQHGKQFIIKDKILVFPNSRGSTVGSYVLYALKYYNNAPKAIIVEKAEPILIIGCILAEIPLAEGLPGDTLEEAKKCRRATLDSRTGYFTMLC